MTLMAFSLSGVLLAALALGFVLPALLRRDRDTDTPAAAASSTPRALRTAGVLALALPLGAGALYLALGTRAGLDAAPSPGTAAAREEAPPGTSGTSGNPGDKAAAPGPSGIGPAQVEAMVQRLTDRLRQQPDDVEGWRMLARSSETLGRFDEAVRAYVQLERLRPDDAGLLTDHAVALAMSLGQRLSGEPEKLIRRALRIDPAHVQALALAGSAAYERGEHAAAVVEWKKILAVVPEGDPMAATIRDSIRKAEALAAVASSGGRKGGGDPVRSGTGR
jgi:cytochrome c-type biogenesis protein CcmH/NrfG